MYSVFDLVEIGVAGPFSGDEDGIPARRGRRVAHDFSQAPLHAISHRRVADTFAGDEAKAAAVKTVGNYAHDQQAVRNAAPSAMDFGNTPGAAKPMLPLHRLREDG
jgi:hypothetical protein